MSSPWGTAEQRANQRRDKRQALLQVAARLFRQQGFAGTSLDQIAAQLGISKPTLYYYVPCKASLVQACADLGMQQALAAVQGALKVVHAQGAAFVLHAYAQAVATDYGWCMVRVEEYVPTVPARDSLLQQRQTIEAALQPVLNQGLAAEVVLRALDGVALSVPPSQWYGLIDMLAKAPQREQSFVSSALVAPVATPAPTELLQPSSPALIEVPAGTEVVQPLDRGTRKQAELTAALRPAKAKRAKPALAHQGEASQRSAPRTQISLF